MVENTLDISNKVGLLIINQSVYNLFTFHEYTCLPMNVDEA